MTERLYYEDATLRTFQAQVVAQRQTEQRSKRAARPDSILSNIRRTTI